MKKLFLLLMLSTSLVAISQKKKDKPVDWSKVDINDKYKINVWKGKNFGKTKKTDTYLHSFSIQQILGQKGALSNKQAHSTGLNLKASAGLTGLDDAMMQKLSTDLYEDFKKQMADMGTKWVDGSEVIKNSAIVKSAEKNKKVFIGTGNVPPTPYNFSVLDNGLYLSAVNYHPENYTYVLDSRVVGNGAQKFATKSKTIFISVNYQVTFVEFDGSVGYGVGTRSASMDTKTRMHITPYISLITDKALPATVTYKKEIRGNGDFGTISQSSSKSNFNNTSEKVGYIVEVDPANYEKELRTALFAIQNAIMKALKEEAM